MSPSLDCSSLDTASNEYEHDTLSAASPSSMDDDDGVLRFLFESEFDCLLALCVDGVEDGAGEEQVEQGDDVDELQEEEQEEEDVAELEGKVEEEGERREVGDTGLEGGVEVEDADEEVGALCLRNNEKQLRRRIISPTA